MTRGVKSYVRWCVLGGLLCLSGEAAAAPASRATSQPASRATSQPASQPLLAPADWKGDQIKALTRGIHLLGEQTRAIAKLSVTRAEPPASLAKLFAVDLRDPQIVDRRVQELASRQLVLRARIDEEAARAKLLTPLLRKPIRRLTRLRQRHRHIPRGLAARAREAQKRLSLMHLEQAMRQRRLAWLKAKERYLRSSQPARRAAAAERRRRLARKAMQESTVADKATQLAEKTEHEAENARKAALAEKSRARSEAGRLVAGERARLEGVRLKQARLEQLLARRLKALATLRGELEVFRGQIAARVDRYTKDWPQTAKEFDALYDDVAAKLAILMPQARKSIWQALRGVAPSPRPGPLSTPVQRLGDAHPAVSHLRDLARTLEKTAERLDESEATFVRKRLALLQREVTWLNEHRTHIFSLCSLKKRRSLTGISRATFKEILREVSLAGFDGVYWVYTRLHQIDRIPGLIVDIFTVGSLLWLVVKLIFLFLLLRYVLKHWDLWFGAVVPKVARSVELGSYAIPAAKGLDILRHIGPALAVLISTIVTYQMLGDKSAPGEVQVIYVFVFWLTVYRLQLRLVEALAKYIGLEKAIRAECPPSEEEEPFVGPPEPPWRFDEEDLIDPSPALANHESVFEAAAKSDVIAIDGVIPVPILAVRSIRIAMLYLLVILLLLRLTAIAVGEGTLYGIVVKVFAWMAIPYAYKLLNWWRPHIVSSYERIAKDSQSSRLWNLVVSSEKRFYGVFVVFAAFTVVFADRMAKFARRYLANLDMTKRILAFLFRRRVAKHAQQAGQVVEKRNDLPQAILNRFPLTPMTLEEGALRPSAMKFIQEAFAIWQEQRADGSVALVGSAGMGKTTLLRMLERGLGASVLHGEARTKMVHGATVVSWIANIFGFTNPSSEKELIKQIREDSRPIVAVDDCHNLFLRRVGGFEGWETFLRIVNETCDNIFWVMSFNKAAYEYLYNAGGQIEPFRRTVEISPWREHLIQKLTLFRMSRAGYRVSFSDLMIMHVPKVDLHVQVDRTSAGYFRMLWDFTGGNPRLASYFWLDSLVMEEGSTKEVKVHLFAEPSIQELEKLPMDSVFVLTAIGEHENLSVKEVAQTTRLAPDFCHFTINAFIEMGFLDRLDHGRVRLSLRWQRPILRFLRRKHLLHSA